MPLRSIGVLLALLTLSVPGAAQDGLVPRFDRPEGPLHLERATQAGAFYEAVGRRAGLFGYENGAAEVWAYPLKIVHDLELDFRVADYPVALDGAKAMTHIDVRPEATTLTYTHAAFTVRQIVLAPIDEAGVIVLLDVDAVRPLTITVSFRPDLSLMWPAGLMTNSVVWEEDTGRYLLVEETGQFAGAVGSPLAEDISVQPYQEEPQDIPNRFELRIDPEQARRAFIPIVVAGSTDGPDGVRRTYDRLLLEAEQLYAENVAHYERVVNETLQIDTPDDRLDEAFLWAKVGIDKGLVTNPYLGTGLIAGYRTAGNSERPGFAWFFGRDALWTAFATTAYGDYATTRTALDFLQSFQREDGKVPHEISQSAALLDWFTAYSYPWNSADATPLYVLVHHDLYEATGDGAFLERHWPSLEAAYRYTAATDTDGNGLVENYNPPDGPDFGHGWVEGGLLYPGREEIYQQGLWIAAAEAFAHLAEAMGERSLAEEARAAAETTREAVEATYWQPEVGYYAFSTRLVDGGVEAWPENTVLQAVPLWWGLLDAARSHQAIDHLGSGALATDWGTRILSAESPSYDPLSYHNGSVWPLFTGWASMGAYAYDRPHVGYQALMASALLTYQDALGYVTELLSGDYNTAFGRSSHHQIWSEAMVATPAVEGLFGVRVEGAGQRLVVAPQLPADWEVATLRDVTFGGDRLDVHLRRGGGAMHVRVEGVDASAGRTLTVAPLVPGDAQLGRATAEGEPVRVDTRAGLGGQRLRVETRLGTGSTEVAYHFDRMGTAPYVHHALPEEGARSVGLRLVRAHATDDALTVVVEGLAGKTYTFGIASDRRVEAAEGTEVDQEGARATVTVTFDGSSMDYERRTLRFPLVD